MSDSGVICHLIDSNIDTGYFRSIARHHDRERFPVMIGSIAPAGPLQRAMADLNVPTFSLGAASRWQYPAAIIKVARLLRRNRVAVLHAHCFDPTFIGLIAARIAGISFVFTRHHSDHNIRLGKRWHTQVDRWCTRHSDHVIAVSEATRSIMTGLEGAAEKQITVIYNGMEPLVTPAPESLTRLRRELMLQNEDICLMIARLHEEKGFNVLFDAIPDIAARAGKLVVLVAGEGPHRAMLEHEVNRRGLQDSVRFLGQRDDIPQLISLASVVVLPSLAESFGFVLLEAMSLGKPVVASTAGGIPEVVSNGETGFLVPPGDAASLAAAVSGLLRDSSLAGAMGAAGRQRATSFNSHRMIHGYEKVYDRVVAARSRIPDVRDVREITSTQ